jgi:hypothetical protein
VRPTPPGTSSLQPLVLWSDEPTTANCWLNNFPCVKTVLATGVLSSAIYCTVGTLYNHILYRVRRRYKNSCLTSTIDQRFL